MNNGSGTKNYFAIVLKVINVLFACFFFIPTMLVSCGGMGSGDSTADISVKDITFGINVMGNKVDGSYWTIISLFIPIVALVVLFIFNKKGVIIPLAVLNGLNNVLYFIYANEVKKDAAENYADFSYKPAFYILMFLFGVYYVVSILYYMKWDSLQFGIDSGPSSTNGFLSNITQKISSSSQEAVQKTKDMASTVALNSENSGLDRKNDLLKQQLGDVVLNGFFSGKTSDEVANTEKPLITDELWTQICGIVAQVTRNNETKEENKRKILELKGEVPCPKCGRMIPKDAAFCAGCGEKSPYFASMNADAPVEMAPKSVGCPQCGKSISSEAEFCKYCGTKVRN